MEGFGYLIRLIFVVVSLCAAVVIAVSFVIRIVGVLVRRKRQREQEPEGSRAPSRPVGRALLTDIHVPAFLFCILLAYHNHCVNEQCFFYPTFAFFQLGQPMFWISYGLLAVIMVLRFLRHARPDRMLRIAADIMIIVLFLIWAGTASSIRVRGTWIANVTAEQSLEWVHDPAVIYDTDSHYLRAVESWATTYLQD